MGAKPQRDHKRFLRLCAKAVLFRSRVLPSLNAWALGVLTKPGPPNMVPTVLFLLLWARDAQVEAEGLRSSPERK